MVPAPSNTTGWYLPSIGEWLDIISQEGIGGLDITEFKNEFRYDNTSVKDPYNVTTNIDRSLEQFDTGKVDLFYASQYYLSASQRDKQLVYGLGFGKNDDGYYVECNTNYKTNEKQYSGNSSVIANNLVRCILAF